MITPQNLLDGEELTLLWFWSMLKIALKFGARHFGPYCFSNWYNCKIVSWTTQTSIVWHNISAPNYRNNKVENTKRKIQHSKILSDAPQTRGTYGKCNCVYLHHLRDQRVPFSFIKMCVSPNKLAFKPHLTNK